MAHRQTAFEITEAFVENYALIRPVVVGLHPLPSHILVPRWDDSLRRKMLWKNERF